MSKELSPLEALNDMLEYLLTYDESIRNYIHDFIISVRVDCGSNVRCI